MRGGASFAAALGLEKVLFLTGERFHTTNEQRWILIILVAVLLAWLMSKGR